MTDNRYAQNVRAQSEPRDKAIWITWYDLPDQGLNAHLSWLHETYIPELLQRPGYLWASHYAAVPKGTMRTIRRDNANDPVDSGVPTGDRYILLIGAENVSVFGDPVPSALHAGLPLASRKMLAMRTGERVNIMVEAARVEGPEAREYKDGMVLAPCIQLGSFVCPWQYEEESFAWFIQARLPMISKLPGSVRSRKLLSFVGWAKHAILYEYASLEARNKNYLTLEDGHPEIKAWSDRIVPKTRHAPGSASLATRIWPPIST